MYFYSLPVVLFLSLVSYPTPIFAAGPLASSLQSLNQPGAAPELVVQQISLADPSIATLGAGIPVAFTATPLRPHGNRVPDIEALNLATLITAVVARQDFARGTTEPKIWSWETVRIAISLSGARRRSGGMPNLYVVWGIFKAMQQMIQDLNWLATAFELKMGGQVVGTLTVWEGPLSLTGYETQDKFLGAVQQVVPPDLPTQNLTQLGLTSVPLEGLTSLRTSNDDLEVNFFQIPGALHLGALHVYMDLLGVLLKAAPQEASQAIKEGFGIRVPGFMTVQTRVTGPGETTETPPREPFFTWDYLIRGIDATSRIIANTRYYGPFKVELKIHGTEIGDIIVEPIT